MITVEAMTASALAAIKIAAAAPPNFVALNPPVAPVLGQRLREEEILQTGRRLTAGCFPVGRDAWLAVERLGDELKRECNLSLLGVSWHDGTRALLLFAGEKPPAWLALQAYAAARELLEERLFVTAPVGGKA